MTSYRLQQDHERKTAMHFRVVAHLRKTFIGIKGENMRRIGQSTDSRILVGKKELRHVVEIDGENWLYGMIIGGDKEAAWEELQQLVEEGAVW
jgi:hypothetical protein